MPEMQEADSKGAELKHNHKEEILLDALLKYVIPFFNKTKTDNKKSQGRLEELVKKEKTSLKPLELIFLEDMINLFLNKANDTATMKKKKKSEPIGFLEIQESNNKNNEEEIRYSVAFERKKRQKGNIGYSVEIKYEENETEERLRIGIKLSNANYSSDKKAIDDKKQKNNYENANNEYSIILEKENKTKNNLNDDYSITLVYENSYDKERLSIQYRINKESYLKKREQALNDFSDRVPGKHVSTFSRGEMPGVLGFTYLGQDRMALRDDLTGKTKKMVDIHESIHTPDEYETRVLTEWIMTKARNRYIK